MTPTNKLRFVERHLYVNKPAQNFYGDEGTICERVKKTILQQWWTWDIEYPTIKGEWRDVPLEKEQ